MNASPYSDLESISQRIAPCNPSTPEEKRAADEVHAAHYATVVARYGPDAPVGPPVWERFGVTREQWFTCPPAEQGV